MRRVCILLGLWNYQISHRRTPHAEWKPKTQNAYWTRLLEAAIKVSAVGLNCTILCDPNLLFFIYLLVGSRWGYLQNISSPSLPGSALQIPGRVSSYRLSNHSQLMLKLGLAVTVKNCKVFILLNIFWICWRNQKVFKMEFFITQSLGVKKNPDLSDKNKTIESQSSEHTRAKLRQYLNDISKKK